MMKNTYLSGGPLKKYFTSCDPHHDVYTFSYWQTFWHSIWHIFWHSIWQIFWHIFWHSTWQIFWHSIWHIFWHSIWHIFWHSIWHIFWQMFWHIFWHIQHIFWHSIWHIFWHSIWHIFWHSFWHSIWHIFWHSFWHSIWHIFWYSFWHIFWHSIWHIFWHSFWHSIWHIFWHFFWHSIWHIFWHSIWHIFWHSFWHIFWHSVWHIFWHSVWHSFWHSIWHIFWHSIWHIFWHSSHWGPAVPTAIWKSRLGSGSAHCDLEVAVEVRQCPLRPGSRGWGPAVPTAICNSRLRSGSAHWDLELAVEVLLCPLGSGLRGGGGGWGGTGGRRRRRRRRRTALIKSNNPHLAGGGKNINSIFGKSLLHQSARIITTSPDVTSETDLSHWIKGFAWCSPLTPRCCWTGLADVVFHVFPSNWKGRREAWKASSNRPTKRKALPRLNTSPSHQLFILGIVWKVQYFSNSHACPAMQRSMTNSPVLKEEWDLGRQARFLKTSNLSFSGRKKLKLAVLRNELGFDPSLTFLLPLVFLAMLGCIPFLGYMQDWYGTSVARISQDVQFEFFELQKAQIRRFEKSCLPAQVPFLLQHRWVGHASLHCRACMGIAKILPVSP